MSLNCRTLYLGNNLSVHVFEAPRVMRRVFLGIYIVAWEDTSFRAHISFDDPKCVNFVVLNSLKREYEFECADIPQGTIFVQKQDGANGWLSAIEILK